MNTYLEAIGTSVQSYPCSTLVTASFISLLSNCCSCGTTGVKDEEEAPAGLDDTSGATLAVDDVTVEFTVRESISLLSNGTCYE